MMKSTSRITFVLALAAAPASGLHPQGSVILPPPNTAPYEVLDRVEGSWINLGLFPVRPLMVHELDDVSTVFALNVHDDRLEWFRGTDPAPFRQTQVGWGPVALAGWEEEDGDLRELLVVCAGSYGLFRVAPSTGEVLGVITLPPEPRDIVVKGDRAWISCTGVNEVVQVDLVNRVIERRYSLATEPAFRCQQPCFLALDGDVVLVAPLLSGNNTTAYSDLDALDPDLIFSARKRVLDLRDPAIVQPGDQGLPDEDLFSIDPGQTSPGAVSVVAHGQGTVLFAHGRNPSTGRYWQLCTEALNADPARQSEPALRGIFAQNRLAIRSTTAPQSVVDLDDPQAGQYADARSIGQPHSLAFASNGYVAVTGPLTDTLSIRKPDGTPFRRWALPAESKIPTGVVLDEDEEFLYVHCHGSNEVLRYALGNPPPALPPLPVVYGFQHDPTPPRIQNGMELFHDASFSLDNRSSCRTCHVDGKTDGTVWNLSEGVQDEKGPLLTQTLTGISMTGPFHWRGERGFDDFRGAFAGLLGAAEAPSEERFQEFEEFIFSLTEVANPRQDFRRVVNDDIHPPEPISAGSPINGQFVWHHVDTVGPFACNDCHTFQSRAAGHEVMPVVDAGREPKRTQFDVAAFAELGRRAFQPLVDIRFHDPEPPPAGFPQRMETRAYLGAAVSHAGLASSFRDFVATAPTTEPNKDDLTAFVFQFDTGLAPSAHFAAYLDASTPPNVLVQITAAQTEVGKRNCELVLLGYSQRDSDAVLERVDWAWDDGIQRFRSDGTPGHTDRTFEDFVSRRANERHVVVGVPVGMAQRFAVDRDMDGVYDAAEAPGADILAGLPLPPAVAPDITGLTVEWVGRGAARISFDTDLPAQASATARALVGTADAHETTTTVEAFSKRHSLVLADLLPSSSGFAEAPEKDILYAVEVSATGRSGLSDVRFTTFTTLDRVRPRNLIVGSLGYAALDRTPNGAVQADVRFQVGFAGGGPPLVGAPEVMLVGRVFVHAGEDLGAPVADPRRLGGAPLDLFARADALEFTGGITLELPGPFLIAGPTTGGTTPGNCQLVFRLQPGSAQQGDEVSFVVEALLEVPSGEARNTFLQNLASATNCSLAGGTNCVFQTNLPASQMTRWSFPATPVEARMVTGTVQ